MKVSVIIPVYNVERHLARCLDSVIAQTWRDIEIICVNDGSTDSSPRILEEYAAREPRMKVLAQANGGLSAARNTGLDAMSGEWVMFVDSDDWIPPYAVEGFLSVAKESGAPAVVSESYAVDSIEPRAENAAFAWQLVSPALPGIVGRRKMQSSAWNKFYRADLLRNRRFIEGIYFEDWPFVTEFFGNVESFALVEEPMYVYCLNGGDVSIVRSPFSVRKVESYVAGIRSVERAFANHPMRDYAMKRAVSAVRMLVSKAWKSNDAAIRRAAVEGLREYLEPGGFCSIGLGFKTTLRYWVMKKALK